MKLSRATMPETAKCGSLNLRRSSEGHRGPLKLQRSAPGLPGRRANQACNHTFLDPHRFPTIAHYDHACHAPISALTRAPYPSRSWRSLPSMSAAARITSSAQGAKWRKDAAATRRPARRSARRMPTAEAMATSPDRSQLRPPAAGATSGGGPLRRALYSRRSGNAKASASGCWRRAGAAPTQSGGEFCAGLGANFGPATWPVLGWSRPLRVSWPRSGQVAAVSTPRWARFDKCRAQDGPLWAFRVRLRATGRSSYDLCDEADLLSFERVLWTGSRDRQHRLPRKHRRLRHQVSSNSEPQASISAQFPKDRSALRTSSMRPPSANASVNRR